MSAIQLMDYPSLTPYTTTIPKAVGTWVLHWGKICVDFFQAFVHIKQPISGPRSQLSLSIFRQEKDEVMDFNQPISGLRSQLSLSIFRRQETDEVIDLKSLCWMLENAPRGPPLLRVARHISSICLRSPHGVHRKRIMASPHLFRLHETFWYLLVKIKWISSDNPAKANNRNVGTSFNSRQCCHLHFSTMDGWPAPALYVNNDRSIQSFV